jgi:hypothetical protein
VPLVCSWSRKTRQRSIWFEKDEVRKLSTMQSLVRTGGTFTSHTPRGAFVNVLLSNQIAALWWVLNGLKTTRQFMLTPKRSVAEAARSEILRSPRFPIISNTAFQQGASRTRCRTFLSFAPPLLDSPSCYFEVILSVGQISNAQRVSFCRRVSVRTINITQVSVRRQHAPNSAVCSIFATLGRLLPFCGPYTLPMDP